MGGSSCQSLKIPSSVLKGVFLTSAGMFAGMGTTISLAGVPSLMASADPLPSWRVLYKRGSKTAILCIFTSASAAIALRCLYGKGGDARYLLAAGLNLLVVPFTLICMKPINDALFAIKESKPEESAGPAKELIAKWERRQFVRTSLGVSAFLIGLSVILCK